MKDETMFFLGLFAMLSVVAVAASCTSVGGNEAYMYRSIPGYRCPSGTIETGERAGSTTLYTCKRPIEIGI